MSYDTCRKSCDPQSNKPKYGKDFFYGKIKSPPFNLERFKETAQKAKETFVGDNKITKAPVGASGVSTGSSKNYKNIIAWALKELGWDEPEYGWTHEKEVLIKLITEAEQRGYERAKRELEPKYGGQG